MQQTQSLYAGYEEYSGIFKGRPTIPAGEVWVFCQWDGRNIVASREDEGFRPPPAPVLKHRATKIYKLRRSATYSMTKRYHEVTAFPVTITWSVNVEVYDPVAYIESGQYAHDNLAQIDAALVTALQTPVEEMLNERLDPQIISNPHNLTPPPLRQLLPMRDFNNLVRGLPEFRRIGINVRAAAASIECPAYQQLLSRVTREPQEAILNNQIGMINTVGAIETGKLMFNFEQRKKMIEAANNLQIAMQQLGYKEQYLQSLVGQVEVMNPQVLPLLQSVIEQMGNVAANGVDPRVARNMFNPILERIVLFPQQNTPTPPDSGMGSMSRNKSADQPTLSQANIRDMHIQQLYQAAYDAGWMLSSARDNELIRIDLGRERKIELEIPSDYPRTKVRVKSAERKKIPLPQKQINQVMHDVIDGSYNLVSLVEALDKNIQ